MFSFPAHNAKKKDTQCNLVTLLFFEAKLNPMPVDTWAGKQNLYICPSCCPSWASGAPSNPMVAFHSRSKMDSCGVRLWVAEMPPSLSRMKRRGKPWQFLTQSRGAPEKEEERSAQLELSLLLCLWGSGCCCWEAILTLQKTPSYGLPRNQSL